MTTLDDAMLHGYLNDAGKLYSLCVSPHDSEDAAAFRLNYKSLVLDKYPSVVFLFLEDIAGRIWKLDFGTGIWALGKEHNWYEAEGEFLGEISEEDIEHYS